MKKLLLISAIFLFVFQGLAQNEGDFQTKASGDWNGNDTWEVYLGGGWIDAVDGFYPDSNSEVTINETHTITVQENSGPGGTNDSENLIVKGTLIVNGNLDVAAISPQLSIDIYGTGDLTIGVTGSVTHDNSDINVQSGGTLNVNGLLIDEGI